MKLCEMGTTGLVEWATTGSKRLRGARVGAAAKVIAKRYGRFDACVAFRNACNDRIRRLDKGLTR